MSATYLAADVDPIIQDLTSQVEAALLVAKSATDKLAAAEADRQIVLQKVANLRSSPALDPVLVDSTLNHLTDLAILLPGGHEKVASDLAADPNNALRFFSRVLTLSANAPQPGEGVPKSASAFNPNPSANDSVEDGWDLVLKHGA